MVVDTVISIDRKPMTMEAILHRDQRTTFHRLLNFINQSVAITTNIVKRISSRTKTTTTTMKMKEDKMLILRTKSKINKIIENVNDCQELSHLTNDDNILSYSQNDLSVMRATTCQQNNSQCTMLMKHVRCDVCENRIKYKSSSNVRVNHRHGRCTIFKIYNFMWISILLFQLIMSTANGNPIKRDPSPKWINPCGLTAVDLNSDPEVEQLTDLDLLNQVIVQAETALSHTMIFRDKFVQDTFKTADFWSVHSQWKGTQYEWLPQIPKQLGEILDPKYFKNKTIDSLLKQIYKDLQIFAVSFEQVVWDQESYKLQHSKNFRETELKLRAVLCEVQTACTERAVPLEDDIGREIMGDEFRKMPSETFRNLRDFLILRDYINFLEFVIQVFKYLRDMLSDT